MRAFALLLLGLALAIPGCLTAVDGVDPGAALDPGAVAPTDLRALMAPVPCTESADVTDTTENFLLLTHLIKEDYGGTTHGEMDVHVDARGTHALQARWREGGFDVLNLDDPAKPRHVGNLSDDSIGEDIPVTLDVKVSTDGATALLGHTGRITLVDIRDLANPRKIGEYVFPSEYNGIQAHMMSITPIGGIDRVFVASQQNWGVWIFNLAGTPDARTLEFVTTYALATNGPLGPHDIWVNVDPLLNRPVLWIANGFAGWLAADVSDPANPRTLGGMVNADPYQSYTHTIQSAIVGDRRLVMTIAEVGVDALKVYDATNLMAPVLLAEWSDDKTNPLAMQHNLQVVGDRLYVAHYERGVFVFNLSKIPTAIPLLGTLDLAPVGHFSVGQNPGTSVVGYLGSGVVGGVWDIVIHHGILYVSTIDDGFMVVGDGCLPVLDPLASSTG